jgi:glycosyltransferase involved in cell wall biosynthesis
MLASGKPVIATNIGEVSNYLSHSINAMIIQPDNIEELIQTIKYLILNPKDAFEIGLKGKSLAVKDFNAQIHTDRLIHFLKSI